MHTPTSSSPLAIRTIVAVAFAVCGIISLGFGAYVMSGSEDISDAYEQLVDHSIGSTETDSAYGGDAYTGIQNAGAQAANNAYAGNAIAKEFALAQLDASEKLTDSVGMCLVAFGLFEIVFAAYTQIRTERPAHNSTATASEAPGPATPIEADASATPTKATDASAPATASSNHAEEAAPITHTARPDTHPSVPDAPAPVPEHKASPTGPLQ